MELGIVRGLPVGRTVEEISEPQPSRLQHTASWKHPRQTALPSFNLQISLKCSNEKKNVMLPLCFLQVWLLCALPEARSLCKNVTPHLITAAGLADACAESSMGADWYYFSFHSNTFG